MADHHSPLAEEILISSSFMPFSEGYLIAEDMVGRFDATEAEIDGVLRGLAEQGFLSTPQKLREFNGAAYRTTPKGWQARERLLWAKGLRHPALVLQREHDVHDLIVAIIMATHIENDRPAGAGRLAAATAMTVEDLSVYLCEYEVSRIGETCKGLADARVLAPAKKYAHGNNLPGFDIGPLGRKTYDSEVSRRLKLAQGESILDLIRRTHIVVFNAWQSEYNPSRTKIDEALERVVGEINANPGLWRPLRIEQATAPGEGALRIDVALQEKIKKADFFVGDMTPVYAYNGRLRVNENVLVEVGFALASKAPSEVILLALDRSDVPGEPENAKPAFDIAHVRTLRFERPAEARARLQTELEAALCGKGWLR